VRPCENIKKNRAVNNAGGKHDWLLFILPDGSDWQSATIKKQGRNDTDVNYAIGTISTTDLTGNVYSNFSSLGFGPMVSVTDGSTTINFGNVKGNALIMGALLGDTNDSFMVNSMTSVVPIPASVYLLGSALFSLVAARRRKHTYTPQP